MGGSIAVVMLEMPRQRFHGCPWNRGVPQAASEAASSAAPGLRRGLRARWM